MRRRTLITTGAAVGVSLLAGCGGNGGPSETADSPTEAPADTPATTAAGENGDGAAQFGTVTQFSENYVVEVAYADPESDVSGTATVRYHGQDYYQRIEPGDTDDVYELYHVDGTDYIVINEETCFKNPGTAVTPDADVDEQVDTYVDAPDAGLTANGTTTIDGMEVYVFEVTGADVEGTLTIYVSVSSGYLRRVESEWGTMDFHSWGEVEPITAPEMECQEFGS
jgi:hypothetical protein